MERNFKRVRRQIVSLLLVFAIVLSIMPLNVLAAKVEPTKVFIRVEGKDATIVHYQEMEVESFDISHINGIDKNSKAAKWHEKNKKPLVLHAIVKALEEAESSVIDPKQFEISEKGDFIKAVGGDFPKDSSGWMFKVNGVVPLITADAYELKDGDVIELFYVPDWSNYHFTKIEASKDKVNVGEEVTFTFTAKKEEWDKDNDYELTKNAKVNIKGKEEVYTTDENGQVAIKFEEPGKYIIEVQEVEGLNIIRPIPVEIVVEEKKATAEEQKDEDIKKTINDATNWKIENDDIGEWEALSIKRAGKDIPKEYLEK